MVKYLVMKKSGRRMPEIYVKIPRSDYLNFLERLCLICGVRPRWIFEEKFEYEPTEAYEVVWSGNIKIQVLFTGKYVHIIVSSKTFDELTEVIDFLQKESPKDVGAKGNK